MPAMSNLPPSMHLPRPLDPTGLAVAARLAAHGPWPDLWIQGDPCALAGPLVALVGTRSPDPYGVAFAQRLAADLARDGIGVLSGGALGIDAAAHRGALLGAGRTVVVLPAGIDHWYPRRHAGLYRDILDAGGCLVSQFAPETPPMHWTFPRRNHLVATLCDALVVVQAPAASGALLTAEVAQRMGRRLLAVPASPSDRLGRGCLRLLQSGARACTSAADVRAVLAQEDGALFGGRRASRREAPARSEKEVAPRVRAPAPPRAPVQAEAEVGDAPSVRAATLDGPEALVYETVRAAPCHVDEVARATGLSPARVQQALLTLLLGGFIEDRGGATYTRSR